MGIMHIGRGSKFLSKDELHFYGLWSDLSACESTWMGFYVVSVSSSAKHVWCVSVCRLSVVHLFSTAVCAYSCIFCEYVILLNHMLFSMSHLVFFKMKFKNRV
jgi:hypothetical protein